MDFSHYSKIKRLSAGFLALWLSGVFFLFCCETLPVQAAEMDSCPLAKTAHCKKSSNDENALRFELPETETGAFDCCGFLPQLLIKARTTEKSREVADIPNKPAVMLPVFTLVKFKSITFFNYHPLLLSRGNTYLKNCVFRI